MKIFEIQLTGPDGDLLYKTLVPEVHVQEKIDTLISMNKISNIGSIKIIDRGDISDRYIQTYIHKKASSKSS